MMTKSSLWNNFCIPIFKVHMSEAYGLLQDKHPDNIVHAC